MSGLTGERLLPEFIGLFVPLEIMNLEEKGGPTKGDWEWASSQADFLAEKSEMLFGGAKKGEVAQVASTYLRVIAVLAFAPGGIEAFGHHFVAYEPEIIPQ
jgi:hypothetical protein